MPGSFSVEQICSKGLALLGQASITDITDTANPNALRCAATYYITRDSLVSGYSWSFATKRVMLVASVAAPAFGYTYQYALPGDCLKVQCAHDRTIKYVIESGYLLTDTDEVGIIYSRRVDESGYFAPIFVDCLSARLARELAMPILKRASAVQIAEGIYRSLIAEAKSCDAIQDNPADLTFEEQSNWLAAR